MSRNRVSKSLRQEGALRRLQAQLDSGVKTKKGTIAEKVPLTESDKRRINKEINQLKTNMSHG